MLAGLDTARAQSGVNSEPVRGSDAETFMNAVASALQPSNSSSIRYYLAIGANASLQAERGFGAEWGTTGVVVEGQASSLPQTLLDDVESEQKLQASQAAAKPAAAVAFHTLYSPASANSKSAHGLPSCSTDHVVRPGSSRRSLTRHCERAPPP